jgi:hypothetical protein
LSQGCLAQWLWHWLWVREDPAQISSKNKSFICDKQILIFVTTQPE